jgi:lysine-N-methylase
MLFVRPDFYDEFHCLASACRHSCCVGWEIDVDEESLRRYQGTGGEIGRALRENIALEPTPHFRLAAGERCPFLREDGLCRLILALGEDSLCDICALHPRFYNEHPDRTEMGLGLCCEEAARLLTEGSGHLLLLVEDDGEGEAEATPLLKLREKVFALLADDTESLTERMRRALDLMDRPLLPFNAQATAAFCLTLERMDEAWTKLLKCLAAAPAPTLEPRLSSLRYARIAEYLIYRHFAAAETVEDAAARLQFCFCAVRLICALEPLSSDALRLFSAEIEYSDENVEKLCEWLI